MSTFIPKNSEEKLRSLIQWGKLRQEQVSEALVLTKDTVLGFLKRQIEQGNWRAVLDVLKGKPMTQAGRYMLGELRSKVARKLIMRLGLRPIIATGLVVLLLPLVLAKVTGEVISWMRNRQK